MLQKVEGITFQFQEYRATHKYSEGCLEEMKQKFEQQFAA